MDKRRKTCEVNVGNVGVGGNNPIRIQSMTTSNTRDVDATIEQAMRLADSGCEIVRVTVQGMKEAEACEGIKNGLVQKGYDIPLVADIHFFPPAAFHVVEFVDKVRINPGNFVDKRASFKTIEYDEESYAKELAKIEEKFSPLVEKCKRLNKAIRIGTNHGSLSDRILNRYGDTPKGMLESALEFARVCRKNDFHNIIFSMKSSNPKVMIQAYRMLVEEMDKLGWNYPLHLGVTEAGEGEDGRIKSAMGIGALLLDGIGDTIRVSLTEDPWHEIDPCHRLVSFAAQYPIAESKYQAVQKRKPTFPKHISMHRDGTVIVSVKKEDVEAPDFFKKLGCDVSLGQPKLKGASTDSIFLENDCEHPRLKNLNEIGISQFSKNPKGSELQIISLKDAIEKSKWDRFSLIQEKEPVVLSIVNEPTEFWDKIPQLNPSLILLAPMDNRLQYCRQFFEWQQRGNGPTPVILNFAYSCSKEDVVIQASAEMGALLCDGLGDGIFIQGPYELDFLRNLSFSILQAARMRIFKTDFISCPSCGRTLFNLQDVSKRIRDKTSHLPGVKIAIMGCIVNGPGEMADADFGYVGSKPGMIDLYVGKECVEKDISFAEADGRLIDLIKNHGKWVEPEAVT